MYIDLIFFRTVFAIRVVDTDHGQDNEFVISLEMNFINRIFISNICASVTSHPLTALSAK